MFFAMELFLNPHLELAAPDPQQLVYEAGGLLEHPEDGAGASHGPWYGNPYRHTYSPYGDDPIFANPQFVNGSSNPSTADFHLSSGSQGIDSGTSSLEPGTQAIDFDGTNRPLGQGYDRGAYER